MFSGVPDSKVLHATSPEVVFSCKSKMAAAKPEIVLCQRRDALETKFQVLYPCSWGMPDLTVLHATSPEVVFSSISKMAAAKSEILLSQLKNNFRWYCVYYSWVGNPRKHGYIWTWNFVASSFVVWDKCTSGWRSPSWICRKFKHHLHHKIFNNYFLLHITSKV